MSTIMLPPRNMYPFSIKVIFRIASLLYLTTLCISAGQMWANTTRKDQFQVLNDDTVACILNISWTFIKFYKHIFRKFECISGVSEKFSNFQFFYSIWRVCFNYIDIFQWILTFQPWQFLLLLQSVFRFAFWSHLFTLWSGYSTELFFTIRSYFKESFWKIRFFFTKSFFIQYET